MAAGGSGGEQRGAARGSSWWQHVVEVGGSRWQAVAAGGHLLGLVQVVLSHADMQALPQLHVAGGCVVDQHGGEQPP
jgi:hypothetical protein